MKPLRRSTASVTTDGTPLRPQADTILGREMLLQLETHFAGHCDFIRLSSGPRLWTNLIPP